MKSVSGHCLIGITIAVLLLFTASIQAQAVFVPREDIVTVYAGHFQLNGRPFVPKGVNYYPARSPWRLFWLQYDSQTVRKDMDIMCRLGFNTFRIFIGFDDLNEAGTTALRLAQLKDLLDLAQERKLKVIITLFDFLGDYSPAHYPAVDKELMLLLGAFKDHKAVFAWDLKNEPDLDFRSTSVEVREWLTWILGRARADDPFHLLTIGWADPANALLFKDRVDFLSFHSYRPPELLDAELDSLRAGAAGKPLLLEEFGRSTYQESGVSSRREEKAQARYFSRVREILHRRGDVPALVWTLYDFYQVPVSVVGPSAWRRAEQSRFGILRLDGSRKPGTMVLTH